MLKSKLLVFSYIEFKTLEDKKIQRIDLYVDESGQETRGKFFVVATVTVVNSDDFRQYCEALEQASGKGKAKWRLAEKTHRLDYLRCIMLQNTSHNFKLFYSVFHKTTDYDSATIDGIAKATRRLRIPESRVYVHVDGLARSKCHSYKTRLRQLNCPVRKVSSIKKEETDSLIRLADALAGASANLEKYQDSELSELFSQAQQNGTLERV